MKILALKNMIELRRSSRNADIELLEQILNKLEIVVQEKKDIRQQYEAQQREKIDKFNKYLDILAKEGVSIKRNNR